MGAFAHASAWHNAPASAVRSANSSKEYVLAMAKLAIYMHTSGDSVLHRSGFSLLAALALPVWALRQRLYKTAFVALLVQLLLMVLVPRLSAQLEGDMTRAIAALLYLCLYWAVPGLFASWWHRHVLARTGYFLVAVEPPPSPATR